MIIGVWGDSIVYGAHDKDALGWVGRLRRSLPCNDNVHVYNFGTCGENTKHLRKRFEIELERIKPQHVIFGIGLNDSKLFVENSEPKVTEMEFAENLTHLFTKAKEVTGSVTVVGVTSVDVEKISKEKYLFTTERVMKYNAILKKVSEQCSIQFIDMFSILDISADLVDGIHPNNHGYEKLYKKISSELSLKGFE